MAMDDDVEGSPLENRGIERSPPTRQFHQQDNLIRESSPSLSKLQGSLHFITNIKSDIVVALSGKVEGLACRAVRIILNASTIQYNAGAFWGP